MTIKFINVMFLRTGDVGRDNKLMFLYITVFNSDGTKKRTEGVKRGGTNEKKT